LFTLLATTQAADIPASTNYFAAAAGLLVGLGIVFGFWGLINLLIVNAAKAAAPEHRTMKPGLFWLMLIPFFNAFWAFKALPAVSNSLKATLDAKGQASGDAGRLVGLIFAWIQLVHYLEIIIEIIFFGLDAFPFKVVPIFNIVLAVIYTSQVRDAKKKILAAG